MWREEKVVLPYVDETIPSLKNIFFFPGGEESHTLYTYSHFSPCWLLQKDQALYWFSALPLHSS
jgi:hypothetical protein